MDCSRRRSALNYTASLPSTEPWTFSSTEPCHEHSSALPNIGPQCILQSTESCIVHFPVHRLLLVCAPRYSPSNIVLLTFCIAGFLKQMDSFVLTCSSIWLRWDLVSRTSDSGGAALFWKQANSQQKQKTVSSSFKGSAAQVSGHWLALCPENWSRWPKGTFAMHTGAHLIIRSAYIAPCTLTFVTVEHKCIVHTTY